MRSGGASDGTTPTAGKIVTSANALIWQYPFEAPPIAIWNETVGSPITITLLAKASTTLYYDTKLSVV